MPQDAKMEIIGYENSKRFSDVISDYRNRAQSLSPRRKERKDFPEKKAKKNFGYNGLSVFRITIVATGVMPQDPRFKMAMGGDCWLPGRFDFFFSSVRKIFAFLAPWRELLNGNIVVGANL